MELEILPSSELESNVHSKKKINFMLKQKPISEKDIALLGLSKQQFQAHSKMFSEPTCSNTQEFFNVVPLFGQNPQIPENAYYDMFRVHDSMTEQYLLQWFYRYYFQGQQNKKEPCDYVLVYQGQEQSFAMLDNQTVLDFKIRIGFDHLPRNFYVFLYDSEYCPLHNNESVLTEADFVQFEKKYEKSISIPIKVHITNQKTYYFYIETKKLQITVKELDEEIKKQLTGNNHYIICSKPLNFSLWVEKAKNFEKYVQSLKDLNVNTSELVKDGKLILNKSTEIHKVRKFCAPGELIHLKLANNTYFKYNLPPTFNDCEIRIKYIENSWPLKRRDIVSNLSQIAKMKVSTLLKEEQVDQPLTTCLYLNKKIIRPWLKFEDIAQIKEAMKKTKHIELVCMSDNFVFYQQMAELSKQNQYLKVDQLLEQITKNKEVIIQQQKRKIYDNSRKLKQTELMAASKVKKQHKALQFFEPIMLYTSNLIYWPLNQKLRKTSISLFSKENAFKNTSCWHYKTSQKIITNSSELDSFKGTVYRGSGGFDYNYEKQSLIEWCCFTSTSQKKSVAEGFAKMGKHPYLFEIKTFSGKPIAYFSPFKTQSEILIKPYTKFKVLDVSIVKDKYKHVKLLELPAPTIIPGHIVIWVANNLKENYNHFVKIKMNQKLQNFELIQLESNEHLTSWLQAYRHLLNMPQVKLHFITNMNRTLQRRKEGIETLEIIRSIDKTTSVVFFIMDVQSKKKDLKARGWDKDPNIYIIEKVRDLKDIFVQKFSKQ